MSIHYSIHEQIVNKVKDDLSNQLESIIIKGLENKGFVFSNKTELLEFAAKSCRRAFDPNNHEYTYYVNQTPFLREKKYFELDYFTKNGCQYYTAKLNSYHFI